MAFSLKRTADEVEDASSFAKRVKQFGADAQNAQTSGTAQFDVRWHHATNPSASSIELYGPAAHNAQHSLAMPPFDSTPMLRNQISLSSFGGGSSAGPATPLDGQMFDFEQDDGNAMDTDSSDEPMTEAQARAWSPNSDSCGAHGMLEMTTDEGPTVAGSQPRSFGDSFCEARWNEGWRGMQRTGHHLV